MRNLNIMGPFAKYELMSADLVANSIETITAMDLRRVLSDRVVYELQPQAEKIAPKRPLRKVLTRSRWKDGL